MAMSADNKQNGFVDSSLNDFVETYISKNGRSAEDLQHKLLHSDRTENVDHSGMLYSSLDIASLAH
jgi:hypothetical protein